MKTSHARLTITGVLMGLAVASCGKPESPSGESAAEVGYHVGSTHYATQCPNGSMQDPSAVDLFLQNCPMDPGAARPVSPLEGLVFQADCANKILTVRSSTRGKLDTAWAVLPNGEFYVEIDGEAVTLASDQSGHANCQVNTTLEIWGKMQCSSNPVLQDKVLIEVKTAWNLGKKGPHPAPLSKACTLPAKASSCYLISSKTLNQCGI